LITTTRQESPTRRTLLPALVTPTGTAQCVAPSPPGDLDDILTRMIAEAFLAACGQPAAAIGKAGGGEGPFARARDGATGLGAAAQRGVRTRPADAAVPARRRQRRRPPGHQRRAT
jgi:hypothetical protein